jgi:hypothetical protein
MYMKYKGAKKVVMYFDVHKVYNKSRQFNTTDKEFKKFVLIFFYNLTTLCQLWRLYVMKCDGETITNAEKLKSFNESGHRLFKTSRLFPEK